MTKVYARLALTEDELKLVRGGITMTRDSVRAKAVTATGDELAFYQSRAAECESLLDKIGAVFRADRSQDAEPDEDDDEDEDDDA